MKYKKLSAILLAAVLILSSLSGCSKNDSKTAASDNTNTNTVLLSFSLY